MLRVLWRYLCNMMTQVRNKLVPKQDKGRMIRNSVRKHLHAALEITSNTNLSTEGKVHEFRKAVKRARALLRTSKFSMDPQEYETINEIMANSARLLTHQRESTVNLKIFLRFSEKHRHELSGDFTTRISTYLSKEVIHAYSDVQKNAEIKTLDRSVDLLRYAEHLLSTSRSVTANLNQINSAILASWEKAKDLFKSAQASQDTEIIHKWRKYVKQLLFQIRFAPHSLQIPKTESDVYEKISDELGEDHDLAILEEFINANIQMTEQERTQYRALIEQDRYRIQQKAFRRGEKVFARQPDLVPAIES